MDKHKEIEEMANIIHRTEFVDISGYEEEKIAEELLKHYQPKIPENAVVLTREEYNELCSSIGISREEVDRVVDMVANDTSKETAEKFARLVEFHSVSTRDEDGREIFTISELGLKEILHEEFGIPYDEIAKEFTGDKV